MHVKTLDYINKIIKRAIYTIKNIPNIVIIVLTDIFILIYSIINSFKHCCGYSKFAVLIFRKVIISIGRSTPQLPIT